MKIEALWENPFKKVPSDKDAEIKFLSSVSVFDALSSRQLEKINNLIHVRRFEEGEIIFRQGDPGVGMYLVRDGMVDIYNESADLTRSKIAVMKQGDFFGEISLLNESSRSATAVSSQKSILLGLFRPDLLRIMDSDPKLGLNLIYRLSQIIAERLRLTSIDTGD